MCVHTRLHGYLTWFGPCNLQGCARFLGFLKALHLAITFLPSPSPFMGSHRRNEWPRRPLATLVLVVQNPTPASISGHLPLKKVILGQLLCLMKQFPYSLGFLIGPHTSWREKKKSELPPAWQRLKREAIQMWFLKEQLICFTHHLPSLKIKKAHRQSGNWSGPQEGENTEKKINFKLWNSASES